MSNEELIAQLREEANLWEDHPSSMRNRAADALAALESQPETTANVDDREALAEVIAWTELTVHDLWEGADWPNNEELLLTPGDSIPWARGADSARIHELYLVNARPIADAIIAAGFSRAQGDVTVEWGVIMPNGDEYDMADLGNARDYQSMWPQARIVSRTVTAWKEVAADE